MVVWGSRFNQKSNLQQKLSSLILRNPNENFIKKRITILYGDYLCYKRKAPSLFVSQNSKLQTAKLSMAPYFPIFSKISSRW